MPASGNPTLASRQAKRAAAVRWHHPDADELARDYVAAKLEDYIKRTVDAAPSLTDEQRERIAALLRPTIVGGDRVA